MFCTQCASLNDNSSSFCDSCGSAISRPSAFSPTILPIPVSPSIQYKPTHPWYIRWFFIIPVFFFWPSFIGPMAALGFTLIRLRNIPSSSVKFGWLFSFISLLWTSFYAVWIWSVKSKWALYTLGFLLTCSIACFLYGIFLAVRGRKPSQFARLLENTQLQTIEHLADALGTSDTAKTKQEFKRAIKQGWLNGYDFNEATGEIRVLPFPRNVFQVCRRSLVGSGFVVLSLCMLVQFGGGIITGTSSYSSSLSNPSRSAPATMWDIIIEEVKAKEAEEQRINEEDHDEYIRRQQIKRDEEILHKKEE
jgi:hypothetical protein